MKKIVVILSMLILIGVLISGCSGDRKTSINEYYKVDDSDDDELAAVFFLGHDLESIKQNGKEILDEFDMTLDYASTIEFETVNVDNGDEWYAIIPKYKGSEIKICSTKLNQDGELVVDKELLTTDKPVKLQCNLSDIIPSSQVTVTYKDKSVTFNPSLSLKDGKMLDIENVYTD